jgi:molybdenum cofactor synthesis domain-containing protein
MKKIKVNEAVGMVLGHDMTKVVPGEFKGVAFHRGYVIKAEDIPEFLNIGKEHIFIMEPGDNMVHEEEAALRIAEAAAGDAFEFTKPSEGRVNVKAKSRGLLKVNIPLLRQINAISEIIFATQHTNTVCQPGETVAGTKIIPLYIAEAKLKKLEALCRAKGKAIEIVPLPSKKVGVVITGSEVFKGRIKDKFGDTIRKKVEALGSTVNRQTIVTDDKKMIADAVKEMKSRGSDVIFVCGGLSVDPDDVTVDGVKASGAKVITYGAPVFPGSMFLYASLQGTPILGAPACVIHNEATIVDVVLPRILAGEEVKKKDIIEYGHGGLCINCELCEFPVCPYCK